MPKEKFSSDIGMDTELVVKWGQEYNAVELGVVVPGHEGEGDPHWGWYTHLDRANINRLIRTLRRARDQAFGADA